MKSIKDFPRWALPEGFIGKTFKGAVVVDLLQTLDNAANGPLRDVKYPDYNLTRINRLERSGNPDLSGNQKIFATKAQRHERFYFVILS